MDNTHKEVTNTIPNSHPPKFQYEWKNDKSLLPTYKSQRKMIIFLEGLILDCFLPTLIAVSINVAGARRHIKKLVKGGLC